jgi:CBS domain-containing protein
MHVICVDARLAIGDRQSAIRSPSAESARLQLNCSGLDADERTAMKVRDIMTRDVAACVLDANLAEAATTMYRRNCGCLPVVSPDGHIAGLLTDRDIAIAVALRGRAADHIPVREVMTSFVYSCSPDDDIDDALSIMRIQKVRRLPVVDADGHILGLLSIDDVVLHASEADAGAAAGHVIEALQGICTHGTLTIRHVGALVRR